jgi:hypothetical protein
MSIGPTKAASYAVMMLAAAVSACSNDTPNAAQNDAAAAAPVAQTSERQRHIKSAQAKFPRIPAGDIEIPSPTDLKNPDFDVGGHCLAEEAAGHGSFDQCLEVVGRELIAIGGPDQR